MKKILHLLLVFILPLFCQAQNTTNNYYLDQSFKEIKQPKKAFYYKTDIKYNDTVTIEITSLKDKQIITREIYYRSEPVGIWIFTSENRTKSLDYNFNVTYQQVVCKKADSALYIHSRNIIPNPFVDNDSTGYKAPVLATGEKRFNVYVQKNVIYPSLAKDVGAEGNVIVQFAISQTGQIEDVTVTKNVNIILDKEAMRLIRNLKFLNPPSLNGKPGKLCLAVPVSFRLEEY